MTGTKISFNYGFTASYQLNDHHWPKISSQESEQLTNKYIIGLKVGLSKVNIDKSCGEVSLSARQN